MSPQQSASFLASRYKEQEIKGCCLDGMKRLPISYSCERRSEYIGDDAACVAAFLHCCTEMESQRQEKQDDNLQLARSKKVKKAVTISDHTGG